MLSTGLLTAAAAVLVLAGKDLDRCIQVEDRERWKWQRKEPLCVVGEQRHCPPAPLAASFGEGKDLGPF